MICPKCHKEMTKQKQDTSHDPKNAKKYDRVVYWCQQDDVWMTVEIPQEV